MSKRAVLCLITASVRVFIAPLGLTSFVKILILVEILQTSTEPQEGQYCFLSRGYLIIGQPHSLLLPQENHPLAEGM